MTAAACAARRAEPGMRWHTRRRCKRSRSGDRARSCLHAWCPRTRRMPPCARFSCPRHPRARGWSRSARARVRTSIHDTSARGQAWRESLPRATATRPLAVKINTPSMIHPPVLCENNRSPSTATANAVRITGYRIRFRIMLSVVERTVRKSSAAAHCLFQLRLYADRHRAEIGSASRNAICTSAGAMRTGEALTEASTASKSASSSPESVSRQLVRATHRCPSADASSRDPLAATGAASARRSGRWRCRGLGRG